MATNRRQKNVSWELDVSAEGTVSPDDAHLAVLMDLRDELQAMKAELVRLNGLLHCQNFIGIPATLRTISRKIPLRRKARK